MTAPVLVEARGISRSFGSVTALRGVSLNVRAGEVLCLLGDNGAGKSTLIKILSGVHRPTRGTLHVDGEPVTLRSPRDARRLGISTVFQDLALVPLMSVGRNFFLGREPLRRLGPLRLFDAAHAERVALAEMSGIGIELSDGSRAVSTLSGGERQCLAIARAVYFGARVLILDEPTSALGVNQAGLVLRQIEQARERGLGVVFITHNVHHAHPLGDRFAVLDRGRCVGSFERSEIGRETLLELMAGGRSGSWPE